MIGPSAIGSENGRPSSITSAPASSRPLINSIVRDTSGWPAVMYGTSALRPAARRSAKRCAIDSDEVVTDPDAIAFRILCFDDGSEEHAVRAAVGEIAQLARVEHVALGVADDPHDWTREHVLERIHGVHDAE